jgi:hypothetical protein
MYSKVTECLGIGLILPVVIHYLLSSSNIIIKKIGYDLIFD